MNEAIPYFHPAEIGILNQLLDIATDFWTIETFIKNHVNSVFISGEDQKGHLHGMYIYFMKNYNFFTKKKPFLFF